MKAAFIIVMLAALSGAVAADPVTPADAFNQGADIGKKFLNNDLPLMPMPAIDNANAVNKLPSDYTGAVPTAATGLDAVGLFAGGVGDLMTPGLQKNSDCLAMVNNSDYKQQVPCDAVKTINESDKSGFVFSKNDPIFTRSKMIQGDPVAIVNAAGFEVKVTEMACAPGTSAVPTETETRICNEAMVVTPGSCQPYQDVVIDHFSNFRCEQSVKPLETITCDKSTTATFTYSCSLGVLNPTTKQCEFTGIGTQVANCSSWGGAFYTCAVTGAGRIDSMVVQQQQSSDPCYPGVYGISAGQQTIWATAGCRANFSLTGLFCSPGFNFDPTAQMCVKPALATPSAVVVNGCAALEAKVLP